MLLSTSRLLLLAALAGVALLAPLAGAQDDAGEVTTAASEATSAAGVEFSADLRSSYLVGHKMVVTVRATNPGDGTLDFPKLDDRPHLVRFELVSASGKKQTRFTTPPDVDEDLR